MDRRPTVETRPPVLIDTIVRLSIPVPCREHVIGDLWERYRSPGTFLIDAIRTVPFIVASQIRRTSTIGALLMQAFLLVVGFAVGAGNLVSPIVPVTAALARFRDAGRVQIADLPVAAADTARSGGRRWICRGVSDCCRLGLTRPVVVGSGIDWWGRVVRHDLLPSTAEPRPGIATTAARPGAGSSLTRCAPL